MTAHDARVHESGRVGGSRARTCSRSVRSRAAARRRRAGRRRSCCRRAAARGSAEHARTSAAGAVHERRAELQQLVGARGRVALVGVEDESRGEARRDLGVGESVERAREGRRCRARREQRAGTTMTRTPHPGRIRPIPLRFTERPGIDADRESVLARVRRACDDRYMDDTSAEQLREQRFQALVEGVPVAAYRWEAGTAGRCLYVSPQIESMLGFPPDAVDGGPRALAAAHPSRRSRAGDERRGRCRRSPACSTTSTASCTPTATSSGCGIRLAGSSARRRRELLRGRLRRRHRAQAGRARADAHCTARSTHRPRQPAPVHA